MSGPDGLSAFEGTWKITRQIADRMAGQQWQATGQGRFTQAKTGLIYAEVVTMQMPGHAPLEGQRQYLWQSDGDLIEVLFADGRAFHSFDPRDIQADAHHDCAPDSYDVRYQFKLWPRWSAIWTVTGPRKDYVMRTDYQPAA